MTSASDTVRPVPSPARLYLGEADARFAVQSDSGLFIPVELQVAYFSLPNHLYEELWLSCLPIERDSSTLSEPVTALAETGSDAFRRVMAKITKLVAVVHGRIVDVSLCLAAGRQQSFDDAGICETIARCCHSLPIGNHTPDIETSLTALAIWINVDSSNQHVKAVIRTAAETDLANPGNEHDTYRPLMIKPSEGILWMPDVLSVHADPRSGAATNEISVNVIGAARVRLDAADQGSLRLA